MSAGRDRSLGGCGTCRSRHVKCDEQRPQCKVCVKEQLTCSGYENRLRFVVDGQYRDLSAEDASRFRRPLFTERERCCMSQQLVSLTNKRDPTRLIAELDDLTLDTTALLPSSITRGPFGVFKAVEDSVSPASSSSASIDGWSLSSFLNFPATATASPNPVQHESTQIAPIEFDFPASDELDLVFSPTLFASLIDPSNTNASNYPADPLDGFAVPQYDPSTSSSSESSIPQSLSLVPVTDRVMPRDAWFLLSHFRKGIIPLLSPVKYDQKLPWHVLHFPTATNALAELNMNAPVNFARKTVLHALISISAFNLAGNASNVMNESWKESGKANRDQAQIYLKQCLRQEVFQNGPKRAKYKDILMAILSMATACVFSGENDVMIRYLLDAEKFIRLRGLIKPKLSRKTRSLHHTYSYLRILHETTLLLEDNPTTMMRLEAPHLPHSNTPNDRFRVYEWNEVPDFAELKDKDPTVSYHDIHLEYPGRWEATMYPDIFGIPESLFTLLSQTTRMGNERDLFSSSKSLPGPTMKDFSTRAKALETSICDWKPPPQRLPKNYHRVIDEQALTSNRRVIQSMVLAMHKALLIFFYRRVYDVNPRTLQHEVEEVKNCLADCQVEDAQRNEYTAGIVWPAFVAACEALSFELQEFFSAWFTESYRKSSLSTFEAARNVAEDIWTRRKLLGDDNISWPEMLRSQRLTVVCT